MGDHQHRDVAHSPLGGATTNAQPPCPDLASLLAATPLFAPLAEEALRELSGQLTLVRVAAREVLISEGDRGDGLYVVVSGRVRIEARSEAGIVKALGELGPGETFGEIALLTGARRTASVHVVEDSELVKVSKAAFDALVEKYPAVRARVAELIAARLRRSQLATFLRQVFGYVDPQILGQMEAEHEWLILPGGEMLFRQGDVSDAAYVVLNGRLRVVFEDPDGTQRAVNEIGPGEIVGEMGLLTHASRAATVYAVRDAELAKFSRANFDRALEKYPQATMAMARIMSTRLHKQIIGPGRSHTAVRTIAIVPANPAVPAGAVSRRLSTVLAQYGPTLWLTSERVDAMLSRRGISQLTDDEPDNINLVAWLNEQEATQRLVLYEADVGWSSWTHRCIRQADHILIVADAALDPTPGEIENELSRRCGTGGAAPQSLVLLHRDDAAEPSGTDRWLATRRVVRHHHIRLSSTSDLERLGRFLAGRAVGLVLGGGGARGLAHIGVIRALSEAGIPIDLVGGSSIGAILAGGVALCLDHEAILQRWRKCYRSIYEFTLPIVSLVKARSIMKMLEDAFGDALIEDLWLPYFCVSTNLSRAEEVIHRHGSLFMAARASAGLPGVIPPVMVERELLVDGGLLNNLPIDVMRTLCEGGTIIASDVSLPVDLSASANYRSDLSGWRILWSRINPLAERIEVPHILSILARAAVVGSVRSEMSMRMKGMADLYLEVGHRDCGILEFESVDKMVAFGYESAVRQIEQWRNAGGHKVLNTRSADSVAG